MSVERPDDQEKLRLLYELLLSIGDTLDPDATSEQFLRTLVNKRNLVSASVWWTDEKRSGAAGADLTLLGAVPRIDVSRDRIPQGHPLWRLALSNQPRSYSAADAGFAAYDIGTSDRAGSWAIYPLEGPGALLMRSRSPGLFTPGMLGQLDAVVRKLSTAIQGGFAHLEVRRTATELQHRTAELDASRELLRTIVDTAPMRVFWKDRDLRYLGCNPAFARDAGYEHPDELVGKDDFEMGWRDQADSYRADDSRVIDSGRAELDYEEPQTTPAGDLIWLRTSKVPLRDRQDAIVGVLGIYQDITEQKRNADELVAYRQDLESLVQQRTRELGETEARASQILASSADGLLGVDRNGDVTFVNPAGCSVLGYDEDSIVGRYAPALLKSTAGDAAQSSRPGNPIMHAMSRDTVLRLDDLALLHADGGTVPVMLAVHPMHVDGEVIGAVVSFVDISEQRATTEAREQALDAAEKLARIRSEFIANMSHEIRTPLNGVLGYAQIGRKHAETGSKVAHAFERILESGETLLALLNDVLDFSKIESGSMRVEQVPMSPRQVVQRAVETVAAVAGAKQLVLESATDGLPRACLGDPLRLKQVLLNLLSNAIKFTTDGAIHVEATQRGSELVFTVSDTGIGMQPEEIATIFDPFVQVDGSVTRQHGGAGLGLAISKRMVDLMGGSIHAESRSGGGSRFEFSVPYLTAAVPAPAPAALPAAPPRPRARRLDGLRILVVEDDHVNRAILEEFLSDEAAEVVLATDGEQALAVVTDAAADAFDTVLMDIQMPGMDGYEATRRIHAIAPGLPVIGQTAHAFADEKARCIEAGMVDHVSKPIDVELLVDSILRQTE